MRGSIVGTIGCTCDGESRSCEACIDSALTYAGGVAGARGDYWAEGVAYRRPQLLRRAWPAGSDKERAIASRKVDDLAAPTKYPELHRRLVELVLASARSRWTELQREPERAHQFKPSTHKPKER